MTDQEKEDLRCDVLLLVAISEEEKQLKEATRALGLPFERRTVKNLGRYFRIGIVGETKVNAVRTDLGPFGHGGSAARAIYFRSATGATAVIQLGMAFGIDPSTQKLGDVLVSTSLIPYDLREVRPPGKEGVVLPTGAGVTADEPDDLSVPVAGATGANEYVSPLGPKAADQGRYIVDYRHATRRRAKASLINMFREARQRTAMAHEVHLGGMLSGGARIFSREFLGELVRGVPQAEDGIIGGEMEGVGLLAVSPPEDPAWIVVKGISDFADKDRDNIIEVSRPLACANATRFVLSALSTARLL